MTYEKAVQVRSKTEAEAALEALITKTIAEHPDVTYEMAWKLHMENIGYFLGYLSDSDRIKAMEMYPEAEHPIFGRQFNLPPKICLDAGIALGEAINSGKGHEEALRAARRVIEDYNNSFSG
jgi:hypothetical protein